MITTALVIFAIASAIGGASATEDNWVAYLVGVVVLAGLLASLAGMVLAIAAGIEHESWRRLWLPLSLFPVLIALLVLGEAFVWE